MPATPWTELTSTAPGWVEGLPAHESGSLNAVIIGYGVALPVTGYTIWADSTAAYTELSVGVTSYVQLSVATTPWVELVG